MDISKENELLFLIDTGADISILKGAKLLGTTEYYPDRKVMIKYVRVRPHVDPFRSHISRILFIGLP